MRWDCVEGQIAYRTLVWLPCLISSRSCYVCLSCLGRYLLRCLRGWLRLFASTPFLGPNCFGERPMSAAMFVVVSHMSEHGRRRSSDIFRSKEKEAQKVSQWSNAHKDKWKKFTRRNKQERTAATLPSNPSRSKLGSNHKHHHKHAQLSGSCSMQEQQCNRQPLAPLCGSSSASQMFLRRSISAPCLTLCWALVLNT